MKKFILWAVVLGAAVAVVYPSAFDKRTDLYAYTKWAADALGLIVGYVSFLVGVMLLPEFRGSMRRGLLWLNMGMFIMGSSFIFGPIINHYEVVNADLVESLHGIGMLGGMIGYLMAFYWILHVGWEEIGSSRNLLLYVLIFFVFPFLYLPTMGAHRTPGNSVRYWTELAGFALGGVMATMTVKAFRYIDGTYRNALNWLLASVILMTLSYPFGPISQPNHFWTGSQGGTYHHGTMALAILVFLGTMLFLKRLSAYAREAARIGGVSPNL